MEEQNPLVWGCQQVPALQAGVRAVSAPGAVPAIMGFVRDGEMPGERQGVDTGCGTC